jgi:molybdopterin synthase catalytic subunit
MIAIKFFAVFREKLKQSEFSLNFEKPLTTKELIEKLKIELPEISQILSEIKPMIAVNQEFANEDTIIKDNDEVAVIPPVSGGADLIRIQENDFSVEEEIERIKNISKKIGGIVTFLGTAREISRGKEIKELEFEHYPQMAEKKLNEIREKALELFDVIEIGIVHRVGKIEIGNNIVLIIAAAEHRKDAFDACEWCIDELKQITPIWKKEMTSEGNVWVEEHP